MDKTLIRLKKQIEATEDNNQQQLLVRKLKRRIRQLKQRQQKTCLGRMFYLPI
jgi:hypothetical protein